MKMTAGYARYILAIGWCDCGTGDCALADDPDTWYAALAALLAERSPA